MSIRDSDAYGGLRLRTLFSFGIVPVYCLFQAIACWFNCMVVSSVTKKKGIVGSRINYR
ncbi:hypothetical protein [Nostoc sp.]|uniref:hypothetical protein n=1 Tax=Nostoc sp. TaxID=1180 RepID=UPI002FF3F426